MKSQRIEACWSEEAETSLSVYSLVEKRSISGLVKIDSEPLN